MYLPYKNKKQKNEGKKGSKEQKKLQNFQHHVTNYDAEVLDSLFDEVIDDFNTFLPPQDDKCVIDKVTSSVNKNPNKVTSSVGAGKSLSEDKAESVMVHLEFSLKADRNDGKYCVGM